VRIRLTVADPRAHPVARELLVDTPEGATAAELASALSPDPAPGRGEQAAPPVPPTLYAGGLPVSASARVGAAPLLDGAVVTIGMPGLPARRLAAGVLELHVVGGPDCGHVFRLPPGEHRLGRAAETVLRVADPELSRVHALVSVGSTRVTVTDLGSTNGTRIDGGEVGTEPVELPVGAALLVGRSTLRLRIPSGLPCAATGDGAGHLLVNRQPRFPYEETSRVVDFPAPVGKPPRNPLAVPAILLPLVLSGVLALVTRSPTMLLFGLMSPVLMIGTWLSERRGGRRSRGRAMGEYRECLARAEAELADALAREARARREAHPDPAMLLRVAAGPQAQLWQRQRTDPDALELRVGTGTLPASTQVGSPSSSPARTGDQPLLGDVPVTLDLRRLGVIAVAGRRHSALGVARALVAQVAAWHSPLDVRLVVLTAHPGSGRDWGWTAYLPHNRADAAAGCHNLVGVLAAGGDQVPRRVSELTAVLAARGEERHDGGWSGPWTVVVLDGTERLRAVPGLSVLLEHGPAHGFAFIGIERDTAGLPVETRAVIELASAPVPAASSAATATTATAAATAATTATTSAATAGTAAAEATATVRRAGTGPALDVVADEVGELWAQRFARALAPLRDATPETARARLPATARLVELVGAARLSARGLCEAWRREPRSTRAVLGVTVDGVLTVDLRRDGPHALVGGTTGAGKSELLQTLIASLAVGNRPDEMSFVLVDYKGGSAFTDCARLPHTLGVVTDLDGHLTQRALVSLRAELRRRERLLRALGARDIDEYHALAGPRDPGLPRLVLVIDEFRVLAEELPDFVNGVVRIAAVGRSLGVHLVLATQRPAGVVSADIRANVSLRVALRVRDRIDSSDVIDSPDAAGIPEHSPGRGYLRSPATPLVQFQAARVGGTAPPLRAARVTVTDLPWEALGDRPAGGPLPAGGTGRTDLQAVVEAACAAAAADGIPRVPAPWLPPLPDVVDVRALPPAEDALTIGLSDDPLGQAQPPFVWDLRAGGHLGVAGGARSGRTTLLRTIAGQVAAHLSPADVHLYAVHDGALGALTGLPHVGAVVRNDDVVRVQRLLARLLESVTQRREALAGAGFASLSEQRAHARATGTTALPYLVLLVDGWEAVGGCLELVEHGRPLEDLLRLAREGEAAGLRLAVTGGRALLLGRLTSVLATRLVLAMPDPMDLALAGIPAGAVPGRQPPGRALHAGEHREVQLAVLCVDLSGPGQSTRLAALAATARDRWDGLEPARLPWRVEPLPGSLALSALMMDPRHRVSRDAVLLGVGGDDVAPVGFLLREAGRRALVLGPVGSGRSSVLTAVARLLAAAGRPVVAVTVSPSPLSALAGVDGVLGVLPVGDAAGLVALRRAHPDLAVLVDDAEGTVGAPVEPALLEILRLLDEDDGMLVVATTPTGLLAASRGVHVELARWRSGLLLGRVNPGDADLLGVRTPPPTDPGPGRALLVVSGRATPVQLARP